MLARRNHWFHVTVSEHFIHLPSEDIFFSQGRQNYFVLCSEVGSADQVISEFILRRTETLIYFTCFFFSKVHVNAP